MAFLRALHLPERPWPLSLGHVLPSRRGDHPFLVPWVAGRGGVGGRGRGMERVFGAAVPGAPNSEASVFQARSSSGEATSGTWQ